VMVGRCERGGSQMAIAGGSDAAARGYTG